MKLNQDLFSIEVFHSFILSCVILSVDQQCSLSFSIHPLMTPPGLPLSSQGLMREPENCCGLPEYQIRGILHGISECLTHTCANIPHLVRHFVMSSMPNETV